MKMSSTWRTTRYAVPENAENKMASTSTRYRSTDIDTSIGPYKKEAAIEHALFESIQCQIIACGTHTT